MEIFRLFTFDAAHLLPNLSPGQKCGRMHGHTFHIGIYVEGPVGEKTGWVMDFSTIKSLCRPVLKELDHSFLNDIPGLENPTSENIARWIWNRLKPALPELSMVEIKETPSSGCRYRGSEES